MLKIKSLPNLISESKIVRTLVKAPVIFMPGADNEKCLYIYVFLRTN